MMHDPALWWSRMNSQEALIELALFLACIALAWLVVWGVRRATSQWELSVLLGKKLIDGVLFPVLLLGMVFVVRAVWARSHPLWIFDFLVPVCLSLAGIRLGVKVLQVTFKSAAWVRPIETSLSWLAWAAVVLWLTGLLPLVLEELDQIKWKIGASHLSVRTLIEGGLTAGLVMLLTLWVSSAIEARLLKSSSGSELSLRKAMSNAVTSLMLFVGLMLSLSAVGIDLTALSVLGGAIGVGIGFGLQKIASNFISGIILLFEKAIEVGDWIEIENGNIFGIVRHFAGRYTIVEGFDGREIIIPNEDLIVNKVINWTYSNNRARIEINIGVAYNSDLNKVRQIMIDVANSNARCLRYPEVECNLTNFGDFDIKFLLTFWINDIVEGRQSAKSQVMLEIWQKFKENDIEIPLPQREIKVISTKL